MVIYDGKVRPTRWINCICISQGHEFWAFARVCPPFTRNIFSNRTLLVRLKTIWSITHFKLLYYDNWRNNTKNIYILLVFFCYYLQALMKNIQHHRLSVSVQNIWHTATPNRHHLNVRQRPIPIVTARDQQLGS